ncbi:hypothetical protein C2845_PM18G03690 [Panicum miliaceum]|uniref:Protein FAR1-RELATED SEQUENCE n=1 Tax=Panicum miliaceum TaxID=4540 RepID=A0A3L6PK75_PANMI|nr:hypothetical protein C2845_PM18G03690 [Panicum miliaceum]
MQWPPAARAVGPQPAAHLLGIGAWIPCLGTDPVRLEGGGRWTGEGGGIWQDVGGEVEEGLGVAAAVHRRRGGRGTGGPRTRLGASAARESRGLGGGGREEDLGWEKRCGPLKLINSKHIINDSVKQHPERRTLFVYRPKFNKLLFDRNKAEDRAEFDTKLFHNVRECAWPIEEHASKFYISAAYTLFRKEVTKSTNYFAREKVEKKYEVVHVKPHKMLPWGRERFIVVFNSTIGSYDCECGLYKHFGILCSHVLRCIGYSARWQQRLGCFDIVAKSIKKDSKKLREYFKNKEKTGNIESHAVFNKQNRYYPTESEGGVDSASEVEGMPTNTYGASGSSSWMSDSELLAIKAPSFIRRARRPKETRFKGVTDYYQSKQKRKRSNDADSNCKKPKISESKKKLVRCGECKLLGHSATQCKKKQVDLDCELPEF